MEISRRHAGNPRSKNRIRSRYAKCRAPVPDLPTPAEVDGKTHAGLAYKILGTIQQTLLVDLPAGRTVYSDAGGMSWMTTSVAMNTQGQGGLGGMLKRAVSGATVFLVEFTAEGIIITAHAVGMDLTIFRAGKQVRAR